MLCCSYYLALNTAVSRKPRDWSAVSAGRCLVVGVVCRSVCHDPLNASVLRRLYAAQYVAGCRTCRCFAVVAAVVRSWGLCAAQYVASCWTGGLLRSLLWSGGGG